MSPFDYSNILKNFESIIIVYFLVHLPGYQKNLQKYERLSHSLFN